MMATRSISTRLPAIPTPSLPTSKGRTAAFCMSLLSATRPRIRFWPRRRPACQTLQQRCTMEGFDALGSTATAAFEAFINYAHSQGTTVILVLFALALLLIRLSAQRDRAAPGLFCGGAMDSAVLAPCMASRCTAVMTRAAFPALRRWISLTGCTARIPALQSFSPALMRCWMRIESDSLPDPLAVTPRTTAPVPEEPAETGAA